MKSEDNGPRKKRPGFSPTFFKIALLRLKWVNYAGL